MGDQSASRLTGDAYQHLYSWYELLSLLDGDYEYGYVEHPSAGSADDVTLHAKPGSGRPSRFIQVKLHMRQGGQYSINSLVEVESGRSLLQKLFDSWKRLKDDGPVEIWLVSNWAADTTLGDFIEHGLTLSPAFFAAGPRSAAGRARKLWREHLGATEKEMEGFCRVALRLRLAYAGPNELAIMLKDRMGRLGMRYDEGVEAAILHEVGNWIRTGGEQKRITAESLKAVITRRRMWATGPTDPPLVLWAHGWTRGEWDRTPDAEIDWTGLFARSGRGIPAAEIWESELLPALARTREALLGLGRGRYIDFRGKLPLSASLAIGAAFSDVAGFSFRAEQPTDGRIALWRSDASASERAFVVAEERGTPGEDLLAVLAITGDGRRDAVAFFDAEQGRFSAMVYAEPDTGTGSDALQSDRDAVALATRAKRLIRSKKDQFGAHRIHLIVYGPATFALFLGQRLNAIGTVVTYERTAEGSYRPAVTLNTD